MFSQKNIRISTIQSPEELAEKCKNMVDDNKGYEISEISVCMPKDIVYIVNSDGGECYIHILREMREHIINSITR